MKKTILILSFILTGIASFAVQSSQSNKIPVICTVIVYMSNIRVQTSSANCSSALNAAQVQTQHINFGLPVIDGGSSVPLSSSQTSGVFSGSDFILP